MAKELPASGKGESQLRRGKKRRELNHGVVLGALLLVSALMGLWPSGVLSRVPPFLADEQLAGAPYHPHSPQRSWSAFRSDEAKNVCVTVANYGGGEIFVYLFQKRALAGAFSVQSQETTAMCSDVTVIEVECQSDACQPEWYISEFD